MIFSSHQKVKYARASFCKVTPDQYYAIRSQQMKRTATHKNTFDKNCSSSNCGVPRGAMTENTVH
jgi:hypothetical protein